MLCLGGGPAADLLPEERGLGAEIQPPGHHHHHHHPPAAAAVKGGTPRTIILSIMRLEAVRCQKYIFFENKSIFSQYSYLISSLVSCLRAYFSGGS